MLLKKKCVIFFGIVGITSVKLLIKMKVMSLNRKKHQQKIKKNLKIYNRKKRMKYREINIKASTNKVKARLFLNKDPKNSQDLTFFFCCSDKKCLKMSLEEKY